MGEPNTYTGQGETISIRGTVRRVTPEASGDTINSLNATEAAANLAYAIEELDESARKSATKKAAYNAAEQECMTWRVHIDRLRHHLARLTK